MTAEYWLTHTCDIHAVFCAYTDASTPVNITNHACWNLSGDCREDIRNHTLHLSCDRYLPVDAGSIPTGEERPVSGTAFDFCSSHSRQVGQAIDSIEQEGVKGIDHSYVVDVDQPACADFDNLRHVATLTHPQSGRQLLVHSDQPAVQIYTANFLPAAGTVGSELPFCQHYGICIENQIHPDAVNKPQFPSVWLEPGDRYRHHTIYSLRHVI